MGFRLGVSTEVLNVPGHALILHSREQVFRPHFEQRKKESRKRVGEYDEK